MAMDRRSRGIILNNKSRLEKIDLLKIKPLLLNYKIFTKSMLKDICDGELNLYDELATRGPEAFDKFIKILREAKYDEEASFLCNDVTKVSKSVSYRMLSDPIGYCLIINNVDFPSEDDKRLGSDADAEDLKDVLRLIGYEVLPIKRNLKRDDMVVALQSFANNQKWNSVDSCIVIILSHGKIIDNDDVIYGLDENYISKKEIFNIFNNTTCAKSGLMGKPKIFIFQTCLGRNEDPALICQESTDSCNVQLIKSSSLSDMLIVHSALPNHRSCRDHDKGSWLCQDLVQVIRDDHLKCGLESMLKSVTRKIQNRLSKDGSKKQGIHVEYINLRADIYFDRENNSEYCQV